MRILAYFDPGSGSMFVQLLTAGLAGVATMFVVMRRRIAAMFRRRKPRS